MITQKQLENFDLTHRHGGNGYVMVQDLDKEYCRIMGYGGGSLGTQAFLAAKSQLSVTRRSIVTNGPEIDIVIPDAIKAPLDKLRAVLANGEMGIKATRIVKA